MPRIKYLSNSFPKNIISNGSAELSVTWDDILWAAITVGRPNRHFIFKHGNASIYEAIFRCALVRMSLEQRSPTSRRLVRTDAAKTLDPTEKGAVNYFLGMVFCKLFAAKLLNTPWLLHLDVFRPQLDVVLKKRSRPDLIGYSSTTKKWNAFECKGRISIPDAVTKNKAKAQAWQIVKVNGTACDLHVGAITYFQGDVLNFYWRDPPTKDKHGIHIEVTSEAWGFYYAPVVQMLKTFSRTDLDKMRPFSINEMDVDIGIHPRIAKHLLHERWEDAHKAAIKFEEEILKDGYRADGLKISAGDSWRGHPLKALSDLNPRKKKLRLK